jgi:putative SOS response-associated peptidase YedK
MCGRFAFISDWEKIAAEFELNEIEQDLPASGDVYPGQNATCIIRPDANNLIVNLRWGFIPQWATPPPTGKLLINARAETVVEKTAFRDSFQTRRCLIVAEGFYEWSKDKELFYFYLCTGKTLGLAGIYAPAITAGGMKSSFVILTTAPNELVASRHNRMPVIIPADRQSLWLNNSNCEVNKLKMLFAPYTASEMAVRRTAFSARRT